MPLTAFLRKSVLHFCCSLFALATRKIICKQTLSSSLEQLYKTLTEIKSHPILNVSFLANAECYSPPITHIPKLTQLLLLYHMSCTI